MTAAQPALPGFAPGLPMPAPVAEYRVETLLPHHDTWTATSDWMTDWGSVWNHADTYADQSDLGVRIVGRWVTRPAPVATRQATP